MSVDYAEPFAWWGPRAAPARPPGLPELVAEGVLGLDAAARLWALVERRASVAVVAGPSRAGKTTLLTALVALLPPAVRRLYLRGWYEPFAFLGDPEVDPAASALLVNEISPHLPVYLWGPGVRRALRAGLNGFQLFATAHAESVDGFVASLAGDPLRVPLAEVAAFGVVVVLTRAPGDERFGVGDVRGLAATERGGIERFDLGGTAPAPAAWRIGEAELAERRRRLLEDPAGFRPAVPRWPELRRARPIP